MTKPVQAPARLLAIRATFASPLYRGAAISLFLAGLGFSAAAPQIALFLVNELHVSLTTAGLFYLTNLTAPVVGYRWARGRIALVNVWAYSDGVRSSDPSAGWPLPSPPRRGCRS